MFRTIQLKLTHLLAMLAITLQVFLTGSMAVAETHGVDVSHFMCLSSGELSPAAQQAVDQWGELLGENSPEKRSSHDECPLCTISHGVPLPAAMPDIVPAMWFRHHAIVRFETGLILEPQGPPVGARGPPIHI
tara:strand:+ start:6634 stop:7032 length:399 start_codon:yes stop_codon:yes gene_type:complete